MITTDPHRAATASQHDRSMTAAHCSLLKAAMLFVAIRLDTRAEERMHAAELMAALSVAERALERCSAWVPKALIEAEEHDLDSTTKTLQRALDVAPLCQMQLMRQAADRLVPHLLGAPLAAPTGDEQPAAVVHQPPLPQPGQNDEQPQQAAPPEAAPTVQPTTQRLLPQPPHVQQQEQEQQAQQQAQQQPGAAAQHCCLCGKATPSSARCGRCRTTVYCGRRCQMEHWLGGHREECTRIVAERFNERVAAVARALAGRA